MRKRLMNLGLAVALASPLALNQVALAQVTPTSSGTVRSESGVAQISQQDMWDAFFASEYDYWDAKVLADFWGAEVSDAKTSIGNKLLRGPETKAMLRVIMADARLKALQSADQLNYFFDSGFDYDDAVKLGRFWGEDNAYENKLRAERNIILGNYQELRTILESRD